MFPFADLQRTWFQVGPTASESPFLCQVHFRAIYRYCSSAVVLSFARGCCCVYCDNIPQQKHNLKYETDNILWFFLKKGVSIRRQEDIFPGSPVLPHESYKLYLFSINKTPVGFSFLGSCSMMTTQSHWCPAVFCHVSKKNGFWI